MVCLIVIIRSGSLLNDFGSVRVDLNRESPLTSVRVYDLEPYSDMWNQDLPYTNMVTNSHIRIVSSVLRALIMILMLFEKQFFKLFIFW